MSAPPPSFPSNAKAFPPGDRRSFRLASCGNHTGQGVEGSAGGEQDPRAGRDRRHKLIDIVVLTVCAVISGCET